MNTYPEINAMSRRDCIDALSMGLRMYASVKPEALNDLDNRLNAMRDRLRRLNATAETMEQVNLALRQARQEMGR